VVTFSLGACSTGGLIGFVGVELSLSYLFIIDSICLAFIYSTSESLSLSLTSSLTFGASATFTGSALASNGP